MEFLKEIFGSEALTYDQLAEKLKGNDKIKIANLASGEYVNRHKLDDAEKLLAAERARYADFDPEWKTKLADAEKAAEEKLSAFKLEQAVEGALKSAKVRDTVAVKAHLSMDNVKLNEKGELEGLSEQLDKLKTDNSYLFENTVPITISSPTPGGSPAANGGLRGAITEHYNQN